MPSVVDEDRRQLHRDLLDLKAERTQHVNRIKGLLAGCAARWAAGRRSSSRHPPVRIV